MERTVPPKITKVKKMSRLYVGKETNQPPSATEADGAVCRQHVSSKPAKDSSSAKASTGLRLYTDSLCELLAEEAWRDDHIYL
jgi:hypothetical protein